MNETISNWLSQEKSLPAAIQAAEMKLAALSKKQDTDETVISLEVGELQSRLERLRHNLKQVRAGLTLAEGRYASESRWQFIGKDILHFPKRLQVAIVHTDADGKRTSITRHLHHVGNGAYTGWSPYRRQIMTYYPHKYNEREAA